MKELFEFNNVSFSYKDVKEQALVDLNFSIKKRQSYIDYWFFWEWEIHTIKVNEWTYSKTL